MLNGLSNVFSGSAPRVEERPWEVDSRPGLRLAWLAVLMLLPMAGIAVRVAYLQTSTADLFAKPFAEIFVSYESIPSQDGRLLSADGKVLATDRREFTVKVHYRWLEEPPDPAWLKSQALSRLSKRERRNPALLKLAEENVLEERDAMWRRFSLLAGTSPEDLKAERAKIQKRIEGIVALVEENRRKGRERRADQPAVGARVSPLVDPKDREAYASRSLWRRLWDRFSHSITTPPERLGLDPIIVKEELDYHPLLSGISLQAVAEIESHPKRYPGLQIDTRSWRDYPEDHLAAHLVGVRKPITAEEAEARKTRFSGSDPLGYEVGDRLGRMGLEKTYDDLLHGLRGKKRITRNRRGEIIKTETVREPKGGSDLVLTLHAGLQGRLERLLDRNLAQAKAEEAGIQKPASSGASLVILDVRTGAVLAAASAPRFSLQELLHPTPEEWRAITSDPRQPFFHRATNMAVAPGSVFKAVTAVALLESGRFDPDASRFCQGFLDRPDQHRCYNYRHFGVGHGDLNLSHAICQSCNVYFFQGARTIGPEPLTVWADRFGIGRPTGIDLPGEPAGNLPKPPASGNSGIVQASFQETERWYSGDTLGLAIGQSRLTVTPMQIARVMAAIANDGYLVTPHIVRSLGPALSSNDAQSPRIVIPEPRPIPALTEGTLDRVREGLEMVVAHPQGTGYKTVRMADVRIAGKTGTAEVGGGLPDHAWFAGYVPADRPKYAFAVVLEHAGSGGQNAGPVARQAVETLLELGFVTGQSD